MEPGQRAEAQNALKSLMDGLAARQERLQDLCEASDRVLSYGESEENLGQLVEEVNSARSAEQGEDDKVMVQLRTMLTIDQQVLCLGWLFGVRTSSEFHPIWAARIQ